MTKLEKLLDDAGQVDDLEPERMARAFSAVRSAVAGRRPDRRAAVSVGRPRRRVVARVGLGLAATVVVAAAGVAVASLNGAFGPDHGTEIVVGQDGDASRRPNEDTGEENGGLVEDKQFADVFPGSYQDDGEIVWRVYADQVPPDVGERTAPSRFTGAELDGIYVQLEELAAHGLSEGEFFSHFYDAETDTVRIVGNIRHDLLPADLRSSRALSYEFAAVDPRQPPDDQSGDNELPTEDD